MGRHVQWTGAVLSPGEEEKAKISHFKTFFQDPSLSQARMSTKGPKQVPFKIPICQSQHNTVRMIRNEAKPVPFKTIIHDSKWRNDKMSSFQDPNQKVCKKDKISSFQDLLLRPLVKTMVHMATKTHFKTFFQDPCIKALQIESKLSIPSIICQLMSTQSYFRSWESPKGPTMRTVSSGLTTSIQVQSNLYGTR